jgi:hypothetical protein
MGLVWGVCQQALIGPGKNHTFVGSYKLPLSQNICVGLVVACSFQQSKIKELMKMKCTALLGQHRYYMNMNTYFNELRHRPTLAHQVWVAYMEMAINFAKVAKGNFCTQETLRQLHTPLALPTI